MARPKKDYILFNMRADAGVMKRFSAYCENVGQTKTFAFEHIVSEYLDEYEKSEMARNKKRLNEEA